MYYPELRNFITQVRQDDTTDIFDAAIVVLDKYTVPGYLDVFENTMGTSVNLAPDDIVDLLLLDLRTSFTYLIALQGITVNDDTISVSDLIKVADALFDLPYYEDKDTLESILSSDQTPIEKLGECINLISDLTIENILVIVSDVEQDFVDNFSSMLKTVKDNTTDIQSKQKLIQNYIRYRKIILQEKENYADRFFMEFDSIGLQFSDYLNLYQMNNQIISDPVTNKEQIAKDLIALAIISEGGENPLIIIREQLANIYSDTNSTTIIDIAVSKILQEFNRA